MTKVLRSRHAESVGGQIIEPGQPIPDDAPADEVKRLEDAGLLVERKASSLKSASKRKED